MPADPVSGRERVMQRGQTAIEANPTEHITLHNDSVNAFNTADRAAMLSAVYGEQRLSNSWHVFTFAYATPPPCLSATMVCVRAPSVLRQ